MTMYLIENNEEFPETLGIFSNKQNALAFICERARQQHYEYDGELAYFEVAYITILDVDVPISRQEPVYEVYYYNSKTDTVFQPTTRQLLGYDEF